MKRTLSVGAQLTACTNTHLRPHLALLGFTLFCPQLLRRVAHVVQQVCLGRVDRDSVRVVWEKTDTEDR